jgi:hypothetical protein
MYEAEEDNYAHEEEESEEIQNELWQEACWIVISSYFEEKGYNYSAGSPLNSDFNCFSTTCVRLCPDKYDRNTTYKRDIAFFSKILKMYNNINCQSHSIKHSVKLCQLIKQCLDYACTTYKIIHT